MTGYLISVGCALFALAVYELQGLFPKEGVLNRTFKVHPPPRTAPNNRGLFFYKNPR